MSDGNEQEIYTLSFERAIGSDASWMASVSLDGYYEKNERDDVFYFSPLELISVYLVPDIRHVWHHRLKRRYSHNLVAGVGRQKQKYNPETTVWFADYGLDFEFSDTFSLVLGASYSRRNYDGRDVDVRGYYLNMRKNF